MLEFSKRQKKKLRISERLEIITIKFKVTLALIFLQNAEIEKDTVENYVIYELSMWAQKNSIKFEIKEVENPIYVKSHHLLHELSETRHCKILRFSK